MGINARTRRGILGERLAEAHLVAAGYEIVERNFRTRYGELDLVAADRHALVFCEVKTRSEASQSGPATPLEAIGADKRRRLRLMAGQWLATSEATRPRARSLRFDAIGITLGPNGAPTSLEHLEDAF